MNDSPEPKTIPKWRIIFYGAFAGVVIDVSLYFGSAAHGWPVSPLVFLPGLLIGVGIIAFGFKLAGSQLDRNRISRSRDPLYGDAEQSERTGSSDAKLTLLRILICLFSCLFFFIAAMEIYSGHTGPGRYYHHDTYRSSDPIKFWFDVLMTAGSGLAFLLSLVWPRKKIMCGRGWIRSPSAPGHRSI
jgi:hypothetical protein